MEDADKKKIILLALICGVILYIDFSFLLKAQNMALQQSGSKTKKLRLELDNLQRSLQKMRESKAKQQEMEGQQSAGIKRIVSENQLVALLEEISQIANQNGVQIALIKPFRSSTEGVRSASKDKAKEEEKFIPVSISLEVSCDYHQLGKFINQLENLRYYICVKNFKISSQGGDYSRQKASLVFNTYVKK